MPDTSGIYIKKNSHLFAFSKTVGTILMYKYGLNDIGANMIGAVSISEEKNFGGIPLCKTGKYPLNRSWQKRKATAVPAKIDDRFRQLM